MALILMFVFGALCSVTATPMDQMTQDFSEVLKECISKNVVTPQDLEALTNRIMPENEAAKCLFACAYMKTGMMDNEGKASADGLRTLTNKYFPNDAKKMTMTEDLIEACLDVNNKTVNDGAKGCERAAMLFKCGYEKVPSFDFL